MGLPGGRNLCYLLIAAALALFSVTALVWCLQADNAHSAYSVDMQGAWRFYRAKSSPRREDYLYVHKCLLGDDKGVERLAILSVRDKGLYDGQIVERLFDILVREGSRVSSNGLEAALALSKCTDKALGELLLCKIRESKSEGILYRLYAAFLLARFEGDEDAVGRLVVGLDSADVDIVAITIHLLRELKGKSARALPVLERMRRDAKHQTHWTSIDSTMRAIVQ